MKVSKIITYVAIFIISIIILLLLLVYGVFIGIPLYSEYKANKSITKQQSKDYINKFANNLKPGSLIYYVSKYKMTDSGGVFDTYSVLLLVTGMDNDLIYTSSLQPAIFDRDKKLIASVRISPKNDISEIRNSKGTSLIEYDKLIEAGIDKKQLDNIYSGYYNNKFNGEKIYVYKSILDDRPISKTELLTNGSVNVYTNYYSQSDMDSSRGDRLGITSGGKQFVLRYQYSFTSYVDSIVDTGFTPVQPKPMLQTTEHAKQ